MNFYELFLIYKKNLLKAVLLVALPASFGTVGLAELPPFVYEERQQQAPESLIIKVSSVKVRETAETRRKENGCQR